MRILFFKSIIFMQEDWYDVLMEAGHEVHSVEYTFEDYSEDIAFVEGFRKELAGDRYDAVASFNFFPLVSDVCCEYQIPYIAWTYDSPIPNFYRFDTPYNHIYHFDKRETAKLNAEGYDMIKHLPLAVNVKRLDRKLGVLTEELPDYINDIAFVGNLYNSRSLEHFGLTSSEYLLGLLEGYAAAQTQFFDQDIVEHIFKHSAYVDRTGFGAKYPWSALGRIIHEEATHQERNHLLRKLAEYFRVDLYTRGTADETAGLFVHPPVEYYSAMPDIFRYSRINLNINYRAIRSGMSARILDIMGAGGFLMTTPQPELFDYFIEDTDFVTFHSLEELIDKCGYYLKHEEERHRIALNGYRKVKLAHSYEERLPYLFESICL